MQEPFEVFVGRDLRAKPYLVSDLTRFKSVLYYHALKHDMDPLALGIVYEGRLLNPERNVYHYGLEQGS